MHLLHRPQKSRLLLGPSLGLARSGRLPPSKIVPDDFVRPATKLLSEKRPQAVFPMD